MQEMSNKPDVKPKKSINTRNEVNRCLRKCECRAIDSPVNVVGMLNS